MLRKDKALLEGLTRKYGKRIIANAINEKMSISNRNNKKLERDIKTFFMENNIDYMSIKKMSNISPLYINVEDYDYVVKAIYMLEDGHIYLCMTNDVLEDRIEDYPLNEINDIREINYISDWFNENKSNLIKRIESEKFYF